MKVILIIIDEDVCRPISRVFVNRSQSGRLFAYARTECAVCQRFYYDEPLEIVRLGDKTKIHKE